MLKKFLIIILLISFLIIYKNSFADENDNKIKFYCGVNLKIPFEKAVKEFSELYKTEFTGDFKGTGHLMGAVKINPIGDIFISPDASYIKQMQAEGLIKESLPLAATYPVIIVQKGNPKGVKGLADFKRKDIKIALANPEAASIGKLVQKIFSDSNNWNAVSENATNNGVFKPTVTEMANDVKMKVIDAAIVWDSTARQKVYRNDFDIIEVESLKEHTEVATIGILSASKNPTLALKFARFLHANDKGQKYFIEESFAPIKNADTWSETPSLTIFSGGMNRIAIEKTIAAFQKREGVTINTTYNGCGILVGQMKAGSKPDAYFACDVSFMKQVQDQFLPAENLSQAEIIIVVKKGNPLQIKSIEDLTKPNIKIGVGHPEQSALGSLTKKILDSKGLYEKIKPNISAETPSADMIISQFKTGSLDVCLVYTTSILYIKNDIEVISIKDTNATALQPYAIANYSNNRFLLERFLDALKENNKDFTNAGFKYLGKTK